MLLEWSDDYLLGIAEIDAQHQEFFSATHRLYDAILMAEGETVVEDAMAFLRTYSAKHFRAEESLMEKHGYTGIEDHKELHARFLRDFDAFMEEYKEHMTPNQKTADEVLAISQDWLIDHIADADSGYAKHIKRSA